MSVPVWLPLQCPIRSTLIELSFGRVFVVDVGPGDPGGEAAPPIVLLHDLFETSFAFHDFMALVAPNRRVIAVDLPGCGDSDHPPLDDASAYGVRWLGETVAEVIGALRLEQVDLLGIGFGGSVALAMAASFPERLRRIFPVAPLVYCAAVPLEGTFALAPSLGPHLFRAAARRGDLRRTLARGWSAPERVPESLIDVYWDRLSRSGGMEAVHAMLHQVTRVHRLAEALPTIETPAWVLAGDRDAVVPPSQSERVAEALGAGTYMAIEGCGHYVAQECPEALRDLLEGLETGPQA